MDSDRLNMNPLQVYFNRFYACLKTSWLIEIFEIRISKVQSTPFYSILQAGLFVAFCQKYVIFQ